MKKFFTLIGLALVVILPFACNSTSTDDEEEETTAQAASKGLQLHTIATVGSTLLDGDECRSLVTDYASKWMFKKHKT